MKSYSHKSVFASTCTFLLLAALLLAPLAGQAAGGDWRFRLTPYLYASDVSGRFAVPRALRPVEIDASFSDVVDNLDFGFMLNGTAHKGRWGLWGDLMYIKLGVASDTPIPIALIYERVALGFKLTTIAGGGSYSLANSDAGHLDVVAGARYWKSDNEVRFVGFSPAVRDRVVSGDESWWDPVIGLRGQTRLGERWLLNGSALGGVGGDSDTSVDISAALGFSFNDLVTAHLGFRYLNVEYAENDFLFDVEFKGPLVGVSFFW